MKLLLFVPLILMLFHMLNTYGKLKKVRLQITHAWGVLKPWLNHKFSIMQKILTLVSDHMPEEREDAQQTLMLVTRGLKSKYIKEKLDIELEADNRFKNVIVRFNSRGGHLTRGFLYYYEQYQEACKSLDNAANSYNHIAEFYNREAREFPASWVLLFSKQGDYPTRAKRYSYN